MMTDPSKDWYGLELMEAARLSSGTLYPLLQRLVRDGWLERTGEAPSDRGGASRRIYRMTGHGVRSADALLAASPECAVSA
jgi:PadR family transcriptional regulator, regulatory protein PadR